MLIECLLSWVRYLAQGRQKCLSHTCSHTVSDAVWVRNNPVWQSSMLHYDRNRVGCWDAREYCRLDKTCKTEKPDAREGAVQRQERQMDRIQSGQNFIWIRDRRRYLPGVLGSFLASTKTTVFVCSALLNFI